MRLGPFLSRVQRSVAFVLLAGLASGCVASVVGADEQPPATFDLVTPAAEGDVSPARGVQVLVPEPVTVALLASQRVVVRVAAREVQYLADTRYADTLTKLTQLKLKRAMEASPAVGAAALPGEGLAIDYQILADIRAFEVRAAPILVADAGGQTLPRSAFVSLTIKILDDRSGNVVASRVFDSTVPIGPVAEGGVGPAYLAALDAALDAALVDIRSWVSSRI